MRFSHPEKVAHWPAPNFVDPELRGPEIYVTLALFGLAASVAVGLRFYVRIFQRKYIGLDDFFLGLGYLCMLGDVGVILWGFNRFQWDRHFWERIRPRAGSQAGYNA